MNYKIDIYLKDSFVGNIKSSSVLVKVFSDQEIQNIDPPSFKKPLYRGIVMGNGSYAMELITPSYVEDVEFFIEGGNYFVKNFQSKDNI